MLKRFLWAAPLLCLGCAAVVQSQLAQNTQLLVYPRIDKGSLALIDPNNAASIATLSIIPTIETTTGSFSPIQAISGGPTTEADPNFLRLSQTAPIDPSRPFILRHLRPHQRYRILARAYNASAVQISLDSSSSVSLVMTDNDAPSMATLPVKLTDTPFAATIAVSVQTGASRFEYLKISLSSQGLAVSSQLTTRENPVITFSNLQGSTVYKVLVEAYKLGGILASSSQDVVVTNDTALSTASLTLDVPWVVTTLAGTGGVGAQNGDSATFNVPYRLAVDSFGNVYVSDRGNSLIRKVTPAGINSTIAGAGSASFADGTGTMAYFNNPNGIALDASGNLYIADYINHRIRRITSSGVVTTLAGNGTTGFVDGTGANARLWSPYGLKAGPDGNFYFTDRDSHSVRRITPNGVVTTVAGNGSIGTSNGQGTAASFYMPHGLGVDSNGYIYVPDTYNNLIRKITPSGVVTTLAGNGSAGYLDGTNASFNGPRDISIDRFGYVYVVDHLNNLIRRISPTGLTTTIAGATAAGFADGTGTVARFTNPCGIDIDVNGCLYLVDGANNRIRKLQ
jgi:sugar lactone lactonase YvrE